MSTELFDTSGMYSRETCEILKLEVQTPATLAADIAADERRTRLERMREKAAAPLRGGRLDLTPEMFDPRDCDLGLFVRFDWKKAKGGSTR